VPLGVTTGHIAFFAGLRAVAMLVVIVDGITRAAPDWIDRERTASDPG
jgi:hypothetical protein